ncbi:pilus assembly protein PilY [Cupriavidus necator]|uniref:Pilus assembly protein PilY n=1 Tax=Cupriavidus necator TaxID=106590 RepID=A0A367PNV8_CUPNE|nr:pilus assembly protein PilY [Cupriavidus necator]RCJ08877.1 pilus assembly protein PilY [Cupriavidus necator]
MFRILRAVALLALAAVPIVGHPDDTDIFAPSTSTAQGAPNILFILDNTANWSKASQQWVGSPTQGQAELLAIKKFVANLKKPTNVGLMMLTDRSSKRNGAYVRFGIRDMMNTANNQAFQDIVAGIASNNNDYNVNSPDEKLDQNSGNYANALYEAWLYLTGADNSWAGMDPLADFAGNNGTNKDQLTTSATGNLNAGFAYKGSGNGAGYNSPLGGGCAQTYIIFIGNNRQGLMPPVPAATDPAITTLNKYKVATVPDVQSAWAHFLKTRPDLGTNTTAAKNGSIMTFTIDAFNAQQNPDFTTMMKNVAKQGTETNSGYFQAGSDVELETALNKIRDRILDTNSVFASVSLPVSVSVRGTYLNQVYLGMFRPDALSKPNWVGNLKQYQLAADKSTTPPTVFLADAASKAVENPTTGFVNPDVTSIWATGSTFWSLANYPGSQGSGGASDAPDGDLVEKGGAGQYLRTTFATSQAARQVFTCTSGCNPGSALKDTPFSTANSSIVATSLGLDSAANKEPVINWVRGGNTLADDPAVANPSAAPVYNIRGFVHGDVLHSRPAVINYSRNADDVVVFYGANDGMLHAVKGGPAGGNELWSFIPSEHFSKFSRMYKHDPAISSTSPKPYFVDGSATVYTYSTKGDGIIDATRGDKAYLFLTMRRGGRFIYALDVSDPSKPTLLWKRSNADTYFTEMGQTWSDLRVAKIRATRDPVLIFGLGYDPDANDPVIQQKATMGRGVMVLNAVTGVVLWQAGPSAVTGDTGLNVPEMAYAMPANMAIIDSDRDGYIDRIYAADTGANIWRINISDADPKNWKAGLLAALGGTGADARKFLYAPDVVPPPVGTNPAYDTLMIGSGDREHPFDTSIRNRYYMIRDYHELNAMRGTAIVEGALGSSTVKDGELYDATANLVQQGTAEQMAQANAALTAASGWYIVLGTGEKVVSGSTTLSGTVMFGTNTPKVASPNSCTGDLGVARIYQLNYLNGAAIADLNNKTVGLTSDDRFQERAGGGYPPTPVPVSVRIGNDDYNVAISGTQVISPPGPKLGRRYRIFWRRGMD